MYSKLKLGQKYSKRDLIPVINETDLAFCREGVFKCKNSPSYLIFVDLDKSGKEKRFKFEDFYNNDSFIWESQPRQNINVPSIQSIKNFEVTVLLFCRIHQKIRSTTQPFVFCGRLEYEGYKKETSNPVTIFFKSIDYDYDVSPKSDLGKIYSWRPDFKPSLEEDSKEFKKDPQKVKKGNHTPPNETERKGLVTSRVGQGWYRDALIKRWNGTCPITGCSQVKILIASHIVGWAEDESNRLNVDNGILLSPNADALFDKHLISYTDDGDLITSSSIDGGDLIRLGIDKFKKLPVTDAMKPFLEKHRHKLK